MQQKAPRSLLSAAGCIYARHAQQARKRRTYRLLFMLEIFLLQASLFIYMLAANISMQHATYRKAQSTSVIDSCRNVPLDIAG